MGHTPILKDLRSSAGPVALAYETNREPISIIIGPTGGGKTESSVRRILRVAREQYPSPIDGIRKCRVVCIGNTYRDLWDKAIASYLKIFNKDYGRWTGGRDSPSTHIMDFVMKERLPDGTVVNMPLHIEVLFRAKASDDSMENFARGLETTCWWLQEMDQLSEEVLSLAVNRSGRYPPIQDRWTPEALAEANLPPPCKIKAWGDSNVPVVGSWLHRDLYIEKKYNAGFFLQPPALLRDGTVNPRAENLHNLRKISPDYYKELAAGQSSYENQKLLMCKPVASRKGQPVYLEFDEERHVVNGLTFDPRLPLIVACDTGATLKHAAVFMQPHDSGRVVVLDEISPFDRQLSIEGFADEIKKKISLRFGGVRDVLLVVDPSAIAKMVSSVAGTTDLISYAQYLHGLLGLHVDLAETNDTGIRRSCVMKILEKHEGLWIDGDYCKHLVSALSGGYSFSKQGSVVSPSVIKNDHSHIAEALEYGMVKINGGDIFYGTGKFNHDDEGDYSVEVKYSGF